MISLDCTLIETVPWSLLDLSGVTGRNHHLSMVVKNAYRPNYLFGEQVLVSTLKEILESIPTPPSWFRGVPNVLRKQRRL